MSNEQNLSTFCIKTEAERDEGSLDIDNISVKEESRDGTEMEIDVMMDSEDLNINQEIDIKDEIPDTTIPKKQNLSTFCIKTEAESDEGSSDVGNISVKEEPRDNTEMEIDVMMDSEDLNINHEIDIKDEIPDTTIPKKETGSNSSSLGSRSHGRRQNHKPHKRRGRTLTGKRERDTARYSNRQFHIRQVQLRCALTKPTNLNPHDIGNLSLKCNKCNALHFKCEKYGGRFILCCQDGKVSIPNTTMPDEIQQLYMGNDEINKNFREYIREYNKAMSFVSFVSSGYESHFFKIQGDVHHCISSLYPNNNKPASYGQLYMLDVDEANAIRLQKPKNNALRCDILAILSRVINSNNPYARSYKHMRDHLINFYMVFYHEPRRYKNLTVPEVAAAFMSSYVTPFKKRCVAVYPKYGEIHKLDYDSMHCDPMTYSLIWPYGESGWHIHMKHEGEARDSLTRREYVCYKLAIRGDFNPVLNAGKLTQQLIVDYYCRIEGDYIKYIGNQQSKLRVEISMGLADALNVRANNEHNKVVLPASFTGSPRNMMANYQDAMTIVRKFGMPDLFITMTCNELWKEITKHIHPFETVNNRPDLVVRVFHAKVNELLKLIKKKLIFGIMKTYIYTIKFQEEGVPQIHLLLMLEDVHKFLKIEDIDKAVCAEIPDPADDHVLYELVKRHMIHGPCSSACMKDGQCSKNFPKDFCDETKIIDGYPIYRRRDDGRKVTNGESINVDNRFVVPYNPYLLKYFQAHINVEICASARSFENLHTYIYKGHDCTNVDDEVTYLNTRYVGSAEAAYRIFGYKTHDQSVTVSRLPVHLPQHDNETNQYIFNFKYSKLMAWFQLNSTAKMRSPYLYPDTFLHYVWVGEKWQMRKAGFGNIVGRMYNVSPADPELYYLRLLLLHVKGATCFEDVRSYNGVLYPTFHEAALQRNLLFDDSEWKGCLDEAVFFQMPFQLRQLFAYICAFQQPSNALLLWDTYKVEMSKTFLQTEDENVAYNLSLQEISDVLKTHGQSLSAVNLPDLEDFNFYMAYKCPQISSDMGVDTLQQLNVINEIMTAVRNEDISICNAYFIDGAAGTGKTYVYRRLINNCWKFNLKVISVGWTRIAAMLLLDGRLVHSCLKIPLELNETSVSALQVNSMEAENIRSSKLIIWDEAPMASANALMCINHLLQDIMNNRNVPFGGKVIVLGGDFRQVLPVVSYASRGSVIYNCIKFSPLWPLFKVFRLTQNMRAQEKEIEFAQLLLNIGNGDHPTVDGLNDIIELPTEIFVEGDLILPIFGDLAQLDTETASKCVILAPKNEHCDEINNQIISLLPGISRTYFSANKIVSEDSNEELKYPTEFLDSLNLIDLPPHNLTLKIGAIVILLCDINISIGLTSGTRLLVQNMSKNFLDLEVITGDSIGRRVFLPRIDMTPSDTTLPFSLKRRQFPVQLAFSITIDKSRGQTFEKVGLYLPEPVFTHGQLYVGMSRVRSLSGLKIKVESGNNQTRILCIKKCFNNYY